MEKNLGHATAYGYAKSKGYSGTEEEFAQLMADYASVGQSAAQSAEQAAASATSASGSAATATQAAQTATSKASEAVTAAGTATTKASEASQSASTASAAATSASTSAQTATTAADTATAKASEASESATTASTAKTDAETARDAAAQSASQAAESARTLTIDATLTQSGNAADAKAVGDEVNELKSALNNNKSNEGSLLLTLEDAEIALNLFNPLTIISGKRLSSTGEIINGTDTSTSDYIPVIPGKTYSCFKNDNTIGRIYINKVCAYDSSFNFVSDLDSISSKNPYVTIPGTAKYIRFYYVSTTYTNPSIIMFCRTDGETLPTVFNVYGKAIAKLSDFAKEVDFDRVEETVDRVEETVEKITEILDVVKVNVSGEIIDGKFIESNGSFSEFSSYQMLKVSVDVNATYYIDARTYYGKYYFGYYDSNGTFISGLKSAESGTTTVQDVESIPPANATFLYVCSSALSNVQKVMKVDGYKIPETGKNWANKKWVVVGDSLTQLNEATTIHYFDYIIDESGITVSNMGVGGTGYVRGYDSSRAFYQRISSVPIDADVVTVFGSGNDMNIAVMSKFDGKTWAQALGTYTDTGTDTICGCVNTFLDNYFAVMTTVPIGIIAPTPWQSYPTTLLTNNRFEDYTNALKQIAAYRGVPFLDLYHHSNLRPENEANRNACFYNGSSLDGNGDGVHPNELGHKIIASKIYEFVKTLLIN